MSRDLTVSYTTIGHLDNAFALLPARMETPEARVMLLAIGLQESRFIHKRQINNGPARGFWQFEQGGGVRGVLRHDSSREIAIEVCRKRGVFPTEGTVYEMIEVDDVLACCFARLLLWTDPRPLPAIGDAEAAWELYMRTWRPGKPHRSSWDSLYATALEEVQ